MKGRENYNVAARDHLCTTKDHFFSLLLLTGLTALGFHVLDVGILLLQLTGHFFELNPVETKAKDTKLQNMVGRVTQLAKCYIC